MRTVSLVIGFVLMTAACSSSDTTSTTPAAPDTTAAAAPATTAATETTVAPTTPAATTTTTTAAPEPVLALELDGLEPLQGGAVYEGWLIIEGEPVSTGTFNISEGALVTSDGAPLDGLSLPDGYLDATEVVITVEPAGDEDPAPSASKVLAGALADGTATLSVGDALAVDFSEAAGRFVLATPSTSTKDDELSGIWFLPLPGPQPGLELPTLPDGWIYEGWVVIDGIAVTSGKIDDVAAADLAAPYGGPGRMPNLPGEDFVANAPEGLTFPTNLQGQRAVVSVEPVPDDSTAPFAIKPLTGTIPEDAVEEPTSYPMTPEEGFLPSGVATFTTR